MAIALRKILALMAVLGSAACTAIPLDRLQPPTASSAQSSCAATQSTVDIARSAPGGVGVSRRFSFAVPTGRRLPESGPGEAPVSQVASFEDFQAVAKNRLNNLPPSVRDHEVTDAIFKAMVKTSAQAQLDRAMAADRAAEAAAKVPGGPPAYPIIGINEEQKKVNQFGAPARLTVGQLKDFADKFSAMSLQPTINAPSGRPSAFSIYFTAYYEGNFIDRFGNSVTKPEISLTIPDTEIAAALTFMLEYVADLIDPTPVLGDQDIDPKTQKFPANTTFYPGGKNTKEPTALIANLAKYKNIAKNDCGVTTANAPLLKEVANAAGDRAAAISGLVSQSWGGISFGLGVLGKFSIGDNQTVGTIVKTAATRLGSRLSYAASYWALDNVGQGQAPAAAPGGTPQPPPPPSTYLHFP